MVKDINEIGLEYAEEHGGGLPLSAKEFCNALALWVQKNCVLKNEQGKTMTVNELEKLLQGSDSITLYNNGQKIEFSLNAELVADISKSLKFPVSNPTETELVGVDELGQQVMIPQSQVGNKLYRHLLYFEFPNAAWGYVEYIDTNKNSYANDYSVLSKLVNHLCYGSFPSAGTFGVSYITDVDTSNITLLGYSSMQVITIADAVVEL